MIKFSKEKALLLHSLITEETGFAEILVEAVDSFIVHKMKATLNTAGGKV